MYNIFVGVDNGVSGTIGVVSEDKRIIDVFATPVFKQQSYTRKKQGISRLDFLRLSGIWFDLILSIGNDSRVQFFLERPMINPARFKASVSAARCLESLLISLENFNMPYEYIDSKKWQKELLPSGLKGKELKTASKDIASRLFPEIKDKLIGLPDGDGILIAEWARRNR